MALTIPFSIVGLYRPSTAAVCTLHLTFRFAGICPHLAKGHYWQRNLSLFPYVVVSPG